MASTFDRFAAEDSEHDPSNYRALSGRMRSK